MSPRLMSSLLVLLACALPARATAQDAGRIFCVVVDDIRFLRSDVESTGRLLAVLRDDVLAEGDLVAVVSTGPSSVAADLRDARDREGLTRAIERVVNGPSVLHGIESGRSADPARLQHHAQVALSTTAEVMRRLGQVRGRQKYLVMLSSRATAALSLEAVLGGRQAAPVAGGAAPADLLRQLDEIAAAARQAAITVKVIDPQDPASTDLLRALK